MTVFGLEAKLGIKYHQFIFSYFSVHPEKCILAKLLILVVIINKIDIICCLTFVYYHNYNDASLYF